MNQLVVRILTFLWLAFCLVFIELKGIQPSLEDRPSDFSNYLASSKLMLQGEELADFYDNDWFNKNAKEVGEKHGAKFSPFPPATAFLYLPLAVFSSDAAKALWLICNLGFIVLLVYQSNKLIEGNLLKTALIFSLFFIPIAANIRLGQAYLLFALVLIFYFKQLKSGQYTFAGSLLGFAAAIKYFPAVYLVASFSKLNRKMVLAFFAVAGIVSLLPVLFFGLSPYQVFAGELFRHLNGNLSGQGQFSFTFQSIDALLANLFIHDALHNPDALYYFPVLKTGLKLLFAGTLVLITAAVHVTFKSAPKGFKIASAVIAGSLIIPASATYHLLLIFPALLLVFAELKSKRGINLLVVLTLITCSVLPHHIPQVGNHVVNTLLHFPRLYGLLALYIYVVVLQWRYSFKTPS